MKLFTLVFSFFSILLSSSLVRANDKDDFVSYSPHVSIPLTTVALGSWLGMEIFKKDLAPGDCTWCSDNKVDRFFMNKLQWTCSSPKLAHIWSNVALGSLGVFSLAQLGLFTGKAGIPSGTDEWKPVAKSGLVLIEVLSLSLILNQLVKFAVARRRPCGNFCDFTSSPSTDNDQNLSFYSGHTATAFALATAATVMVDMSNFSYTPQIAGINFLLASLVGYLRIAANKHHFTDVITGALAGIAIGYIVPKYLHPAADSTSSKKAAYQLGFYQTSQMFMFNITLPL